MKFEISQSSILAAREIVKDKNIINTNKRLHVHNISTFHYVNGEQFIKVYGKDEFLELVPMKLNVAIDMIWSNKITDVKTIIGLLWFQKIKNTLK